MSDGDQRIARMNGCASLGKAALILLSLIFVFGLLTVPTRCGSDGQGYINLNVLGVLITLRQGLRSYELEYDRYPVDQPNTTGEVKTTSRGLLLSLLIGENSQGLNKKGIKFCEFKMARKRRDGIFQVGEEWILNDPWGREFHIVLDTDKDARIANPDLRESAQKPTLPLEIAIFSAGPDGDPATWEDNIKSW